MNVESYYDLKEEEGTGVNSALGVFQNFFSGKKKFVLIIIIVLIALVLFFLFNYYPAKDDKLNITSNGEDIAFAGSLTVNGELVETFASNGRAILDSVNTNDNGRVILGINNSGDIDLSNPMVVLTNNDGSISFDIPPEYVIVNPDGTISIEINFQDLNDFFEIDFVEDELYEFNFQITFNSDNNSEVLSIEIPYQVTFQEFSGTGCLLINKSSFSGTLKNGVLEVPIKIRITCDALTDLKSKVNWNSDVFGNVEILFSNKNGSIITPEELPIYVSPSIGEYSATIFYVPKENAIGKLSQFSLNFLFNESEEKIDFLVANENLSQCVSIESIDSVIENDSDNATIVIDSSKCSSEKINFVLCNNDAGCSGGAEGSIDLSVNFFSLTNSSPTKSIIINRSDIPGLYGVSVHASLPGTEKVFIGEKDILVLPTSELVFPEKFSVSLIGAKDSVRIKNTSLASEVKINTSICNLYENSFGVDASGNQQLLGNFSNSEEWVNVLLNNPDYYSGRGFYQSSFYSILPFISQIRTTAYNIAVQENAKIKQAYTTGQELDDKTIEMRELSGGALEELGELNDELSGLNQNADMQLTSQIASLVTSLNSIYSDFLVLNTNISTAQTTVTTLATTYSVTCAAAEPGLTTATTAMASATSNSLLLYSEVLQVLNSARDLYSLYQQIDALANKAENIDAESALKNSEEVNEKLNEIEEKMVSVLEYLDLALQSASIDSLELASQSHVESKNYLEEALMEMQEIVSLKDDILEKQLAAKDDLTVLGDDSDERTQLIIESTKLILDLIEQTGLLTAKLELIRTSITTAQSGLSTALAAATGVATGCSGPQYLVCSAAGESGCPTAMGAIPPVQAELATIQTKISTSYAGLMSTISTINTIYNSIQLYESLSADYYGNLVNALEIYSKLLEDLYNFELDILTFIDYLELAIGASENLSILEKESSDASTYLSSLNLSSTFGDYDKERLVGLIGTLVSNAFVNGAYDGGVYTTKDTTSSLNQTITTKNYSNANSNSEKLFFSENGLLEDCSNRVDLTLPFFKINLLQDAKTIELSSPEINAYWSFNDLEVLDVFEEQKASIIFANAGLKKNSFITINIPLTINDCSDSEVIENDFSPFDIPCSKKEVVYPFHMKINVAPRTGSNVKTIDSCNNGLLLGNTGEKALPKILLDWDWQDINSSMIKEKYLDATQLSILLSKRLSVLNEFLLNVNTSCPENIAFSVLNKVTPTEFNLVQPSNCFLPLTTLHYDEKPALYYFLNSAPILGELFDPFFEELPLSSGEQLNQLLDFNVLLMRDGFGLEFQSDFSDYYSKTLLKASPEFVDPQNGLHRYFNNSNKFYFSNETIDFKQSNDFVLPDAGLYEIKPIIEFDSLPLFSGGALTSKIIVNMDLKEPINSNYSPFYYTPFDGGLGLKNSNGRRFYGSSISNNSQLQVSLDEPSLLKNDQPDSLVKINSTSITDFFLLNSFASNNGRILDYSFVDVPRAVFSPTIATPLLFVVNGLTNQSSIVNYFISKNEKNLVPKRNNLLFLTGLDNCNDFSGIKLKSYINKTPDFVIGDGYGFSFIDIQNNGKTGLTSIIYSNAEDYYSMSFGTQQTAITTNQNAVNNLLPLEGIKSMPYNNAMENDYIKSLNSLFDAVRKESVCVSSFGNKEIFYWAEKKLFETKNSDGVSLQEQINIVKQSCLK